MVQQTFTGRTRLLRAAEDGFRVAPYAAVGVAQILDKAAVKAPSLYHHFGDKEGLFVEWAEAACADCGYTFDASESTSVREDLVAFARHLIVNVGIDIPQLMRDTSVLERSDSKERIGSAYAQAIFEPLCGILLNGMDSSQLRLENIGRVAEVFLAGCWLFRGTRDHGAEIAGWWADLFLNGLAA